MKRSQSSNARPRTRFSRSGSASSPRKPGWKISISIVVCGTLLLVSVFFLLARLGGFGSHAGVTSSERELENESWMRGELGDGDVDELDDQRLKLFEKKLAEGGTRDRVIDFSDSDELDENPEFEGLESGDEKVEEFDEDELDGDDSGVHELSDLKQDSDEDDDEDDFDEQSFRNQTEGRSVESSGTKRLERMEQIKSLPRNIPGDENNTTSTAAGEKFLWDKLFGIIKMPLDDTSSNSRRRGVARKLGFGKTFAMGSSEDSAQRSNEDLLGEDGVAADVDDALFLRRDKQQSAKVFGVFSSQKPVPLSNVFESKLARKVIKPPFDPSNPTGSVLLQDPDTLEPWGLSKSDKAMSRAMRRGDAEPNDPGRTTRTTAGNGRKELLSEKQKEKKRPRMKGDDRKWGAFPGLDPMLLFSEFLEGFLVGEKCQARVFMAWNSPPWSFTVRHQRGLESLLHFHPGACVVVFSETVEINFFKKFWTKGFRVAVVRPNLEELLAETPAEMFASVWLQWRKINLFYLHYSELLRLAALYKYGGLYLDSDVIVLKPLTSLHNVVGLEVLANGTTRINGAVMAFDKGSSFMKACLEEYNDTYDDKLVEWNGADLLTRVATRFNSSKDELHVVASSWFFPVSSSSIISYFEEGNSLELSETYTIHLWNRQSGSLVPDRISLVGAALEQHCIWCDEII